MSLSYYTSSSTNNLHQKSPNVCFTLPITCQICLGKVKEPVVCPNLHAFCSFCIDIWLEKSKQCPTCRVPISKDNPCRKILGGSDAKDDLLVPTDFSHSSTRKARFNALFQQYEDEINRLMKQVDGLNSEISQLKDPNRFTIPNGGSPNSTQQDMVQLLKIKLEQLQSNYEDITREREKLKESNKKLESENSILFQEIQRLKMTINETKSQMTSRYTVAALETKLENYEKEIKQLQKALEKSDNYISELENTYIKKKTSSTPPSTTTTTSNQLNSPKDQKSDELKFIKGDNLTFKNELKVVKFVENNEIINNNNNNSNFKQQNNSTTKHSYLSSSINDSANKISNDKFYGSPKKISTQQSTNHITSFNDRLKKNLSFDLEIPSPLTQSLNNSTFNANASNVFNSLSYNDLLNDSTLPLQSTNNQSTTIINGIYSQSNGTSSSSSSHNNNNNHHTKSNSQHDFLFSPMKRLRLEEFQLEKPNFSTIDDDTLNQTALNEQQKSNQQQQQQQLNMSLTPEFNDCLQLLNEAESKIQNRSSPFVSKYQTNTKINSNNSTSTTTATYPTVSILKSNSILPDKYLRPQQQQQQQQQQRSPSSILNEKQPSPTSTTIRNSNSFDYKLNTDQLIKQPPSPSSGTTNNINYDYYTISSGTNFNSIYGSSPYRSRSVEPKS